MSDLLFLLKGVVGVAVGILAWLVWRMLRYIYQDRPEKLLKQAAETRKVSAKAWEDTSHYAREFPKPTRVPLASPVLATKKPPVKRVKRVTPYTPPSPTPAPSNDGLLTGAIIGGVVGYGLGKSHDDHYNNTSINSGGGGDFSGGGAGGSWSDSPSPSPSPSSYDSGGGYDSGSSGGYSGGGGTD